MIFARKNIIIIAKRIIAKWESREGHFIKFKDGNTLNCRVDNLEYISFYDTFSKHYTAQRVDWDCDLTQNEKRFAIENWDNWYKVYF